jgi:putative aldouronate transport system permease protein
MVKEKKLTWYSIFQIFNYTFLILLALACILPMIHLLAVSLSSSSKASAGVVALWPVDFTTRSYEIVLKDKAFWRSMLVSFERIIIGGGLGMITTIFASYPLSRDSQTFKARKYYVWFIFFTMLFGGGLVPGFLIVYYTGLMDTIWALTIPGAVSAWNIILMLNFFRQLPKELNEAARVDGAGHWITLFKIILPISKPVLATVGLFIIVGQWNSWFDGMLYMRKPESYPLQTYLQSMLTIDVTKFLSPELQKYMDQISTKTLRAAQIFIGAFPILCAYPFLQKYFTKGLVLGSVKG